ncbi:hypothetical protein RclHR1_16340003 [Rhizophagus clarus]|uniref:Crinkler effector protein N-terminal domain-containing protein n=1 Tax=Rhizophagus clarus TaxID=94130 RepID=A0A2Z6QHG9_9GLOM|nr:hypothetical protein RclHR1_16340003 [Rhizophagus clarus]GES96293.1 hypothetical protein GLOIN_2v1813290 [Rhizophagus clarus]
METNDEVKLQCLVLPREKGVCHKPSKEFTILPVNIPASYSVGHLKEAIYAKKTKAFAEITADELILSLVSISCDELITLGTDPEAYVKIRLLEKRRLVPIENVSEIFPQDNPPAPKHVHILVELPDDEISDDSLEEQKKSQTIINEKIRIFTACIYIRI